MKKLLVLTVMVSMVMGFSFAVMADAHQETAQLDVGIEIGEYFELGIVSEFFRGSAGNEPLFGLFNQEDMIIGVPGYYVSDGLATVVRAQELFGRDDDPINQNFVDKDGVEMVVVAANTDTVLDMTVDWGVAGQSPELLRAFFRFSSNYPDMNDTFIDPVIGADDFLGIMEVSSYNTAMLAANPAFNNDLLERGNITFETFQRLGDAKGLEDYGWGTHRGYVSNFDDSVVDTIDIPYRECTPTLLHINGALEIMKSTGLPAGLHNLGTIELTLSADEADYSTWSPSWME